MTESHDPEMWLPVVGFEDRFEVSDRGRVRSVAHQFVRSNGVLVNRKGTLLKLTQSSAGHLYVNLKRGGHQHRRPIHQLVLAAFVGPRPPGAVTRHLNGNPADNRPSNLAWGDQRLNMQDSVRHGTNRNTQKVACKRNHLLAAPNLMATAASRGHRGCLACHQALNTVWYAVGPRTQSSDPDRWDRLLQAESDRRYRVLVPPGAA